MELEGQKSIEAKTCEEGAILDFNQLLWHGERLFLGEEMPFTAVDLQKSFV
jgi:hypothetical protein